MYFKHIPRVIQSGLSSAIWALPGKNSIYLTFDDGPSNDTDVILSILADHDARASFFLLGENIEKYPEVTERVRTAGHGIGNHGYSHIDGWQTSHQDYIENVERGRALSDSDCYRPPYGRMTPRQWRTISKTERIVMWSVMPGDFDPKMDADSCFDVIRRNVGPGSIIVLHDNVKSMPILLDLLPKILLLFKEKGLQMEPLPSR